MTLHNPSNPAQWADGTPRSQNNGFTCGFGAPINWDALAISAMLRKKSTKRVEQQRASGIEPARIYGLSHKSDELLMQNRHSGAYGRAKAAA